MQSPAEARKALVDDIVKRWNAGDRGSAIAMSLRVTRSTVMGIVKREKERGRITRVVEPPKAKRASPAPRQAPPPAKRAKKTAPPSARKAQNVATEAASKITAALPATARTAAQPMTLIDAPLFTCRVVVGRNERGQDLYCCEPLYRLADGRMARISCCEAHKPRMFSKHSLESGATDKAVAAIDRLSTTLQREPRGGSKKLFAFGKTLGVTCDD